jgi:hypothetical protein
LLLLLLLLPPGRRETMGWGGGSLPRRATVANLARSPTGMMDRFQVGFCLFGEQQCTNAPLMQVGFCLFGEQQCTNAPRIQQWNPILRH